MAVNDRSLHDKLITVFNDADRSAIQALQSSINTIEGVDSLSNWPRFLNVKLESDLESSIDVGSDVPSLSFIDPFGYLGVTHSLVENLMTGWGSECVLFFNYNQINRAISNPLVSEHIDALFTQPVADDLRQMIQQGASGKRREAAILDGLTKSLSDNGRRHLLFFRFKARDRNRTSHYIVHITGHPRGYFIMRDVMAGSSAMLDDIPLFEWSPVKAQQLDLDLDIEGAIGIPELRQRLISSMAGRNISVKSCYEEVTLGTPYLRKHFTKAVDDLEISGKVTVSKSRDHRFRRGQVTLGDSLRLSFPR